MGVLFGAPLLLVEGDDDMRIWSQVPRHGVIQMAVIPCKGEQINQYRRTLEQIFAAIRDPGDGPAGFVLYDGDKALPEPRPDDPQEHVRAIRLNCREAENLYLTDEVLDYIGTDWESSMGALQEAAPKFGKKEHLVDEIDQWDRQSHDVKELINEIARTLDSKGLHWTVRVGKTIGASRPDGQLAEFLGPSVVDALWGSQADASEKA